MTAWLAGGVATTVLLVITGVAFALALDHGGLRGSDLLVLGTGLGLGVACTALAAIGAAELTAGLRQLQADAARRLTDPGAPIRPAARRPIAVRVGSELAGLARTLDALHLRARVADEVAEQQRRTADHASAGMFELLSGLVAAEEATRGQLSAELHDTVAQSLMLARSLLGQPDLDPATRRRVAGLVEEAEEQVRAVMARARPPALREGDLASAVSSLRRDMAARYGLEVRVLWPDEPHPMPLVSAVTVYRFFQEALLNVVKHADVDEAQVSLAVDGRWTVATVRDEGPGFDPSAVRSDRGRHVGLGLLRERARLAGGALDVQSAPGAGTTLTLRLPGATPPETAAAAPDAAEERAGVS